MQIRYPKFSIARGMVKATGKMHFTVIERKNGRVIATKAFEDQGEASGYVQSQLNMDRDFAMES